jgi:AcrR family transcriptional regulator
MPSLFASPKRTTPQQERAERRVQALLEAAAGLFAEAGFEAATMTAIAERSGTSIGGLYRYFPDKAAVAQALLRDYAWQAESRWGDLPRAARDLPVEAFAGLLLAGMEAFVADHPAYLALLAAPVKFAKDPEARRKVQALFAQAFQARQPELSPQRAMLITEVVLQFLRGMMELYGERPVGDRPAINLEFKRALTHYLKDVLA